MLSKLSVEQMNLPESEKCDWKYCNITWTTANSKYDKTTHNPLVGIWGHLSHSQYINKFKDECKNTEFFQQQRECCQLLKKKKNIY